jgi:hypothetical protein
MFDAMNTIRQQILLTLSVLLHADQGHGSYHCAAYTHMAQTALTFQWGLNLEQE